MRGQPCGDPPAGPPRCTSFVPHERAAQEELAEKVGVPVEKVRQRVKALHEQNPMLGLRGCRLGINVPGDLQHAGARHHRGGRGGDEERPACADQEIMIPLVGKKEELSFSKKQAVTTAERVLEEAGCRVH